MSEIPADHLEQLSAFMDGELPDAEARFLLRRLENDAGLRAAWERMQLASACVRAQAWQPMAHGTCASRPIRPRRCGCWWTACRG